VGQGPSGNLLGERGKKRGQNIPFFTLQVKAHHFMLLAVFTRLKSLHGIDLRNVSVSAYANPPAEGLMEETRIRVYVSLAPPSRVLALPP